jgi:hypothetical protein
MGGFAGGDWRMRFGCHMMFEGGMSGYLMQGLEG